MAARKPTTSAADKPAAEASETAKTDVPAAQVGQVVLYRLSEDDTKLINLRRSRANQLPRPGRNGIQAHLGNTVTAGDTYPMIVVRVWEDGSVNGQVVLDGNDSYWATSRKQGTRPNTWSPAA